MKSMLRLGVMAVAMAAPVLGIGIGMQVRAQAPASETGKKTMKHASGSFEVKIAPAESSTIGKEGGVGRMTIDKLISGDMVGITKGEMLTSMTESTGAVGYVALETVTATLDGHSGTFVLTHNATMKKGAPDSQSLHIAVVPGSGTGGLTGISGTFAIHIDGSGKHTYMFDYELP